MAKSSAAPAPRRQSQIASDRPLEVEVYAEAPQHEVVLSRKAMDDVRRLLDEPAEPCPELVALFRRHAP